MQVDGLFGYIITNFMSYLDFDLYSKVDVVAGSSIGGILTLAYCCNSDYKWINRMFEEGGPEIFDHINPLYLINSPKYDNENLKKFLKKIYGDMKLSDLKSLSDNDLKTIITTMDFTLSQPRIFDNINIKPEQDISLVDLGLFTSAAPTYFNAHNYPWKMMDYDVDNVPINEKILVMAARQQEIIAHNKDFNRNSIIYLIITLSTRNAIDKKAFLFEEGGTQSVTEGVTPSVSLTLNSSLNEGACLIYPYIQIHNYALRIAN
jgi:hypothetical protein